MPIKYQNRKKENVQMHVTDSNANINTYRRTRETKSRFQTCISAYSQYNKSPPEQVQEVTA